MQICSSRRGRKMGVQGGREWRGGSITDPGGREWRGGAITQTQETGFAQNAPFIALFNDHEQIIKRQQMSLSAVE